MIYLAYLEVIVKLNFQQNFCLHNVELFCLEISSDANIFSSLVQGIFIKQLIVIIIYYF